MSVVLEGFVKTDSEDVFIWTGSWQFAKEKKSDLKFTYQWSSSIIDKNLYEFVSFIDEETKAAAKAISSPESGLASVSAAPKQKKTKKRGPGRPPVQPHSDSTKELDCSIPRAGEVDACGGEEAQAVDMTPHMDDGKALDSIKNQLPEVEKDENEELVANAVVVDVNSSNISSNCGIDNIERKRVIERSSHPFLGVWEGSFAIRTAGAKGGQEQVKETLFFHSILGKSENRELLSDLPPDPLFPYTILRKDEIYGPDEANVWVHSVGAIPVSASSSSVAIPKNTGTTSTANGAQQTPSASQPSSSSSSVILVGFGRNIFGRFSAAALYDPTTGELRCEKKYMLTKIPIKRGRRSFAELAAEAVAAGESYPPPGTSASDMLRGSGTGGSRKSAKEHGDVVSSSRIRHAPVSYNYDDEVAASAAKKNKKTWGAVAAKDAIVKEPKKLKAPPPPPPPPPPPIVYGPNALIGFRNPDNDPQDSYYKEAYQDCDSGEIYEGGWAYGLRHGFGICLHCDGLMYEGNWNLGREHGKGILMTSDRQMIYSGDWVDGMLTGNGTYFFGNGDKYVGDWKEGSRHGKGDYIFANGCRYSGDWRENKRVGRGLFVWSDQSYYDGDWDGDMRHGRGYLELVNGFKYDGYWSCNMLDGKGKCTFPGGQSYEGTYKTGLREGRGSITFSEGAVYEGRFKEDRFDGQGTVKVSETLPGAADGEVFIPIQIQSELWRIHLKAGFGNDH